jgi:arsenite methyltransferase
VINLSPNKQAIFREAFRVLKPGGCLAISDILQKGEFSESIKQNEKAFSG